MLLLALLVAPAPIAFRHADCGSCPNNVSQIGVRVEPTPAAQQFFRDAAFGNGFTMSSAFANREL